MPDHVKCTGHGDAQRDNTPTRCVPSSIIVRHIVSRQHTQCVPGKVVRAAAGAFAARHLPSLMREREYSLGRINKVFAARWVSDRQVVFGTKCNKLIVLDLYTMQMARIPSLQGRNSSNADALGGIHAIAVNPSCSKLATGGVYTNNLAIYQLPTFDPVCVGEGGHEDWLFDIHWLDDEFLVSGSRDNQIALWRIRDEAGYHDAVDAANSAAGWPHYNSVQPLAVKTCKRAEKVRALSYNGKTCEIAALSLNAYLHFFDAKHFVQKSSRKLTYTRENVCMSLMESEGIYAIGSQSHICLIDPRTPKSCCHIASKQGGCGIRSLQFNNGVLSIGTGAGAIYFFDMRARNYLNMNCGHTCGLMSGRGWLNHDEAYMYMFVNQEYANAIYTHSYDQSGTRIFAAGGPLPACLSGNYAGLWQ